MLPIGYSCRYDAPRAKGATMMRVRPILTLPILAAIVALTLLVSGCDALPFAPTTPLPPNTLAYDAPVSLDIKAGTTLPGTTIAYSGKTDTGAGKILIAKVVAPKQVGDTVDWQGTPATNVSVKLSTRVATFDEQSIKLVGTAHVEIRDVTMKAGGTSGTVLMEFNAPVSISLNKNEAVPGSNVTYVGATNDGAQFLGVEGFPFRKPLDSLQYVGRVSPKVFLKLDLRVTSFSDSSVLLVGTANIKIES
jgi:hypothetical protein